MWTVTITRNAIHVVHWYALPRPSSSLPPDPLPRCPSLPPAYHYPPTTPSNPLRPTSHPLFPRRPPITPDYRYKTDSSDLGDCPLSSNPFPPDYSDLSAPHASVSLFLTYPNHAARLYSTYWRFPRSLSSPPSGSHRVGKLGLAWNPTRRWPGRHRFPQACLGRNDTPNDWWKPVA